MNNKLSIFNTLGLGFMTFAFFLGAGNIIFPVISGALAGQQFSTTMLGFLLTAVGLPLVTLIAVAKAGGGLLSMAKYLPHKVAIALALVVFIIIGPSFAVPRTALVAFEIGLKPFLFQPEAGSLAIFSIIFFTIVALLSISAAKLLDIVGKVITPLLIILLIILSFSVFMHPISEVGMATGNYIKAPFISGFLEGYNTMDTLGSLVFGMLIINVIKSKGVSDRKAQYKYLLFSGLIAATGLTFVYISLFYLGATSQEIAGNVSNGGEIIALYVKALFGLRGQALLSVVVALACLTTAVGLVSAMSDFLCSLKTTWNRHLLVIVNCALCALVTNIGLNELIALSIPVLFTVYPMAITLVALTLFDSLLPNKSNSHRFILSVSFIFGLLDGIKASGINMDRFSFLPLFDLGLAWVLPTAAAFIISVVMFKSAKETELQVKQAY
ncbi:MAG: branched-chain amino acid transport system II carrier protein [Psychromonas sp.]|nr:branched-chain amino acid transport system II carrier protein [Psychromonas sp.]